MRRDQRMQGHGADAEREAGSGAEQEHGAECRRQAAYLTPAERLLLWGMRTYVGGLRLGVPVMGCIRRTFAEGMAEAAAEPLEAVMIFLTEGARRPMEVKCPRCPAVSDDERLLLRLAALGQAGDDASTMFLAREVLVPGAVQVAAPVFRMLGAALLEANLRLPPAGGTAAPRRAPRALLILPQSDTVH